MEVGRSVEVLVDAGEAQVGDFVDDAELIEDGQTDVGAGDSRTEQSHRVLDDGGDGLEPLVGHVAPLRCCAQPADELLAVERFAPAVRLDHGQWRVIDTFERREALRAGETLTATADRRALFGDARVDDLGVIGTADGTEHVPKDTARLALSPGRWAQRQLASSGQAYRLADLDDRTAVEVDEGIDEPAAPDIAAISIRDRPERVARLGDVHSHDRRSSSTRGDVGGCGRTAPDIDEGPGNRTDRDGQQGDHHDDQDGSNRTPDAVVNAGGRADVMCPARSGAGIQGGGHRDSVMFVLFGELLVVLLGVRLSVDDKTDVRTNDCSTVKQGDPGDVNHFRTISRTIVPGTDV